MNYTNREVVRRLKQYDMFLNSLNLATDEVQRERICDQLDKIEKQILLETNTEYEEQYLLLLGEETKFFPEEKSRLRKLISLILERKNYLEGRKNKHRDITGSLVELTTFLGEDKITAFKRKLDIIEKYEENKRLQESLIKDMKMLDIKLSEASRAVKANTRLNDILENKMKDIINKALNKYDLLSLTTKREEIINSYENYEYALNLAKDNLKIAKKLGEKNTILECETMLKEVTNMFSTYNEKINILKLIDTYDKTVNNYDELLEKREIINTILKNISGTELYNEISDELNKEYNTIKLEKQDIENYESLKQERERKNRTLYEIDEENNSKEFKEVIDELVKNETRLREEQVRRAKKEEYQERQRKLLEEQKIEASRIRRQKLIEEARLKEQQERLEKMKELQEKTKISIPKEEVVIKKEEPIFNTPIIDSPIISKPIINPLKDKTLDEVMSMGANDDFDSDELFENTKIVPNKKSKEQKSLFEAIDKAELEEPKPIIWEAPKIEEELNDEEVPVLELPTIEETIDLFKEEPKVEEVIVKEEPIEIKEPEEVTPPVEETKPSIYDILENNKNIIWKTTDTNINTNTIPVIGNNNLKPEILDNRNVNNITYPNLNSKEGEILWKETL